MRHNRVDEGSPSTCSIDSQLELPGRSSHVNNNKKFLQHSPPQRFRRRTLCSVVPFPKYKQHVGLKTPFAC